MAEGYRESLKHPEAEELFDLGFYRPVAWLFVRAVHRTPLRPNAVTMLSLAASLAAAYCFAFGGMTMLWAAAAWYALANVLDCADGQLARIQKSGTPNGRLVDGIADYAGTAAIFVGIGVGFSRLGLNLWPETVLAGLTSALHAMIFDQRQGAFIAARRGTPAAAASGGRDAPGAPGDAAGRGIAGVRGTGAGAGRMLSGLHDSYERLQHGFMRRILPPVPEARRGAGTAPEDGAMIRLWSFLGPTTNRTALIAFALIGRVDLYLWAVMVPGNLWLAALWYLQRRLDARPAAGVSGSPDGAR